MGYTRPSDDDPRDFLYPRCVVCGCLIVVGRPTVAREGIMHNLCRNRMPPKTGHAYGHMLAAF